MTVASFLISLWASFHIHTMRGRTKCSLGSLPDHRAAGHSLLSPGTQAGEKKAELQMPTTMGILTKNSPAPKPGVVRCFQWLSCLLCSGTYCMASFVSKCSSNSP